MGYWARRLQLIALISVVVRGGSHQWDHLLAWEKVCEALRLGIPAGLDRARTQLFKVTMLAEIATVSEHNA